MILNKVKKALVIAAHPDDEVLGCGGTLNKLAGYGAKVYPLFLSDGESSRKITNKKKIKLINSRKTSAIKSAKILKIQKPIFLNLPDNSLDSVPLLEIIKKVEKYVKRIKPDLVFTHSYSDLNIDHQIANKATVTACRPQSKKSVKNILFFEVLSSTEWNFSNDKKFFRPNLFVGIDKNIKAKIKALKCYKSEIKKWPHARSMKSIINNSQRRGSTVGLKNAEAFEVSRIILN